MLINIGFGNLVAENRIVSVISPDAAPAKRIMQDAREHHMLIDATSGRRTKSVIIADSGHIILSYMDCEKLQNAVNGALES